jgi:hypothetical protein
MPNATDGHIIVGDETMWFRINGGEKGYSFKTNTPFDGVIQFYKTKLAELGWDLISFSGAGGTTKKMGWVFIKDSIILTLLITTESDNTISVRLILR